MPLTTPIAVCSRFALADAGSGRLACETGRIRAADRMAGLAKSSTRLADRFPARVGGRSVHASLAGRRQERRFEDVVGPGLGLELVNRPDLLDRLE